MSDFETDVQRVERMLQTCGCSSEKARKVLNECLKRNKKKMNEEGGV